MKIRVNYDSALIAELYNNYSMVKDIAMEYAKIKGIPYSENIRKGVNNVVQHKIRPNIDTKPTPKNHAKILIFDLETAPGLAYIWGFWNQNPGHNLDMVETDWFMLTWSAKWLFEDQVMSDRLTGEEAAREDDSRLVANLWDLIDEADIVIAHNALKFDVRKMNSRFLLNGLTPPSSYEVIDTLVHARKRFAMSSNKLDYLAKLLNVGGKVSHEGFPLWKKCVKGDDEALKTMSEYNDGDVTLLEEVYLKMRPWIKPHPNVGLHVEDNLQVCPSCGSSDLVWSGSVYRTYVNEYPTCKCNKCGAEARSRKAITSKERRDNLLVSLPR